MASMTYEDRLKWLGLERLALRRLHTDLITCYKIINNLVAVQFDSLFKFAANTNTRGHSLKLMLPDSRVNARAHAFLVRVITVWNRLSADVVRSSSLPAFKSSL